MRVRGWERRCRDACDPVVRLWVSVVCMEVEGGSMSKAARVWVVVCEWGGVVDQVEAFSSEIDAENWAETQHPSYGIGVEDEGADEGSVVVWNPMLDIVGEGA